MATTRELTDADLETIAAGKIMQDWTMRTILDEVANYSKKNDPYPPPRRKETRGHKRTMD